MYCVSKVVAVGTETLNFGRKVKVRHILITGDGGISLVVINFDVAGPYPYTTTWTIQQMTCRTVSNTPIQVTDIDIECRNLIFTTTTTAARITVFFEYKSRWPLKGKRKK